ncbi:MAG: DNA-3-methyladenine glycosylase I [Armatimonadetes bacterium]|nr:DNA-3-methyladenine glycosylase I [Armatimonadota bacterium]MDE2205666.1 DNA-3-methyladenine glycosylase I [Armatimonadota bacterium]
MTTDLTRCPWSECNPAMQRYHDEEWAAPVHDDKRLFEFIILEGAQAGLSWNTILNRRDGYREAFAGFDPVAVASFTDSRAAALMENPAIIRNRAKIMSAISNAQAFLAIQEEFGSFAIWMWDFVGGRPIQHRFKEQSEIPAVTAEAEAWSKALRERGFRFMGPTICYAHMQAVGMVNDHLISCHRFEPCAQLGASIAGSAGG